MNDQWMTDLPVVRAKDPNINGTWYLIGKAKRLRWERNPKPDTDRVLLINTETGGINIHFRENQIEPYPGSAPSRIIKKRANARSLKTGSNNQR